MAGRNRLIVVRHAEAHPLGYGDTTDDPQRQLTENGALQAQRLAVVLFRLGLTEPLVLSSPFARARQTADLIAAGTLGRVEERVWVAGASVAEVEGEARRAIVVNDPAAVILVGHEPTVGLLIGRLLDRAHGTALPLGTATAVCVDLPSDPGGKLCWWISHQVARVLAD